MTRQRSLALLALVWLVGCLLVWANPVQANVIWPPAVYYYTLGVWWVVISGLVVEFVVHILALKMPVLAILRITLLSNIASAIAGFVLMWPAVFWNAGVTKLAAMAPFSTILILSTIFVMNVILEYLVAVRWLSVLKGKKAWGSFLIANVISYGLIVWAALSDVLAPA